MEYIDNRELYNYVNLQPFSEKLAKYYFIQLLDTLVYLHYQKSIAHRDIKLENLMID